MFTEWSSCLSFAKIGKNNEIPEMQKVMGQLNFWEYSHHRYNEYQKETARAIIEKTYGDYCLALKENQKRTYYELVLYTINQEQYLRKYLEDGHLSIYNNATERAIKNFAVGCRNWLFSKSIKGAEASATVYSITEIAILNGLKPYDYLNYILEQMKALNPFPSKVELLPLLPWSEFIPKSCRTTPQTVRKLTADVTLSHFC